MPYSNGYYGNTTELSNATPVSVGDEGNFSVTSVDVELIPLSARSVEEEGNVTSVSNEFELSKIIPICSTRQPQFGMHCQNLLMSH